MAPVLEKIISANGKYSHQMAGTIPVDCPVPENYCQPES
jgi:hypothetical protein